jgi:hypothetical protein
MSHTCSQANTELPKHGYDDDLILESTAREQKDCGWSDATGHHTRQCTAARPVCNKTGLSYVF